MNVFFNYHIKRNTFILALILASLFIKINLEAQEKNVTDYSLKSLQAYQYKTSPITIQKLALKNELQYAYDVKYTSMELTVSARLSIPANNKREIRGIVIMLRGHQRQANYYTGKGTENPARRYIEQGWAVIAPDFLGYAASSPAPSPDYLHQFYSTINAIELYKSLEQPVFQYSAAVAQADRISLPAGFKKITLWGHSNGGQVALHFLEIVQKPVAAVLWAPLGLPFPESAGHFGRGSEWLQDFKKNYNAADFSLIDNLDKIAPGTPILIHQGDNDTAVPKTWNDALAKAIEEENIRRDSAGRGRINLRYEVYKGADHNLSNFWYIVIPRDIDFW